MKKYLFIVLLVGVWSCTPTPTLIMHSPESSGFSSRLLMEMKEGIHSFVDDGKIPFIQTAIVKDNKLIHFDSYGYGNINSKKQVEPNSIFRIASMTKPVISVAVMMLNERGYLKLDDPISKHMAQTENLTVYKNKNEFGKPNKAISVIDLLRHTSGIGYNYGTNRYIDSLYKKIENINTNEEFVEKLFSIPLFSEPSTEWRYGFSTDVLGRLIEEITGQSLYEFLSENIFKPLEMNDTHFQLPLNKINRFIPVYAYDEQENLLKEMREWNYMRFMMKNRESGGGGLISTTSDYINFCSMLLNGGLFNGNQIISPNSIKKMTQNQIGSLAYPWGEGIKFGYGFYVVTDSQKSDLSDSNGSFGWSGVADTHFSIDPEKNMILILMTQRAWPYSGVWKVFNDMTYRALNKENS